MRLAVISDIHGNLLALEAVLADIARRGADLTVNLGDCAAGPLWPRETVELLESLALPTVRGNHDRWAVELPDEKLSLAGRVERAMLNAAQCAALHALPPTLRLAEDILAVHGTPTDDNSYLLEELHGSLLAPAKRETVAQRLGAEAKPQLILCGHSHRQAIVHGPGGCTIVNPGSVGCPVYADRPDAAHIEYRSPHARYAVLTRRGAHWAADLIALDYDWDAAAKRAAENGNAVWARSMATGAA